MKAAQGMGKPFVISSVAVVVVTLAATSAMAATYYASQSSGDDRWSGKAAAPEGTTGPWKTLAKASTVEYAPGDRLLLKCGDTWNEALIPKGNGTPDKPILIGSYGEGDKPVIDREDDKQDRFGIQLSDQEGFKIVGLEFNRCMTGIYARYDVGCPTKKYIWIEDCYFHDSLTYGDYKSYPRPRNISLGICFFSYERENKVVLKDITIKNCVFRRLASGVWTNSPDNFNKKASNIYNFANMTFEDCLFEEGYQWQLGIRGVDGGAVRNCVTHDIGRGFRAWNGVAGAMFFRCKNWVFENSEWGFIDIGQGSWDGEAFDFEGNCDDMTMRNCLFHDTDGPGFLICCYASDWHPNKGILMENCVLNGKAKRPMRGMPRCEIINTTDWNETTWKNCRFYLAKGEVLMKTMDPEKDKKATFTNCVLKDLSKACSTPKLAAKETASPDGKWIQLDFGKPTTVNEFKIKEDASSSVIRYAIQCWDDKASKWIGCFNGRTIGADFMAPIVSRTTTKARLLVMQTKNGKPVIAEFAAYNDTTGEALNVARGGVPPGRVGQ